MDEEQIRKLTKAAVELEELDADVAGGQPRHQPGPRRKKLTVRWWTITVPAAAAAGLVLIPILRHAVLPQKLTIREFAVVPSAAREVRGQLRIELALNRPAYARIVFIDERYERWIMPFDAEHTTHVTQVGEEGAFVVDACPCPDDPRGPAMAVHAMVVASPTPIPTADDLLAALPDPIVPPQADDQALLGELDRLRRDLERRFPCVVRVERIPW